MNYIPTIERLMLNSKTNKQAGCIKGAEELTVEKALIFQGQLRFQYEQQEILYQAALRNGVPKELARVHIGVGRYSKMRASAVLRNWLAFMTLRSAEQAQWEIRTYSDAIAEILRTLYPRTMELFDGNFRK